MKKRSEWFDGLPEPYKTQAIDNTNNQNPLGVAPIIMTKHCLSISTALSGAFSWG